jgi:signal peptidase I
MLSNHFGLARASKPFYNPQREDMEDKGLQSSEIETITDPAVPKEKHSGFWRFVLDIIETVVLSVLLFAGINAVSARIRVDGFSMQPTLQNGEFVIVNKLSYKLGNPQTGDVIVFRYPRDPKQEYIKRVIGLPGDNVKVSNGKVYVNNQQLNEPYIAAAPKYQTDWHVPAGALFVLGDNRNNSSDSHDWGAVPMNDVIGKAWFVYWPPQAWGVIYHPSPANAAP